MAISKEPSNAGTEEEKAMNGHVKGPVQRKRVVVVGLGMVGIAFM